MDDLMTNPKKMDVKCAACCLMVDGNEDFLQCSAADCNKYYHLLCTGVSISLELRTCWICPECVCKSKKGGDNSSTPVGSSKKTSYASYVTVRNKVAPPCITYIDDSTIVADHEDTGIAIQDVKGLMLEIQSLRGQLHHAVGLISGFELTVNVYSTEVQHLRKQLDDAVSTIKNFMYEQTKACTVTPQQPLISAAEPVTLIEAPLPPTSSCSIKTVSAMSSIASQAAKDHATAKVIQAPKPNKAKTSGKSKPKSGKQNQSTDKVQPVPADFSTPTKNLGEPTVLAVTQVDTAPLQTTTSPRNPMQWTEVRKQGNRRPPSLCGTAGPAKTTLKAVEPRKYMHVWNMESDINEVRDYLHQLYPAGTCTVQELRSRGDYKSYKIGVPLPAYDICFSEDAWPINARIKPWIPYHKPLAVKESARSPSSNNRQSFRGFTTE